MRIRAQTENLAMAMETTIIDHRHQLKDLGDVTSVLVLVADVHEVIAMCVTDGFVVSTQRCAIFAVTARD